MFDWNINSRKFAKMRCKKCGENCELVHTTGDCCACFDVYSNASLPWCSMCMDRFKKLETYNVWFDKNQLTLDQFLQS